MELLSNVRCFGGEQRRYSHTSSALSCDMHFSVFLPAQAQSAAVPVLYWLSGLTCSDENFVQKAGAQRYAAEHGIAIVCPDTSPRGEGVADDPDGAWDFGQGAGFYINASQSPWQQHFRMYDYLSEELPELLHGSLPLDASRQSLSGHSMGGHGALILALRQPQRFLSVSAFAPICAPTACPWGQKAFSNYLGDDRESWGQWDACELIKRGHKPPPLLVDQGAADDFLVDQLMPERLQAVAAEQDVDLHFRLHPLYEHSYFFIASFIGEHIAFHAQHAVS